MGPPGLALGPTLRRIRRLYFFFLGAFSVIVVFAVLSLIDVGVSVTVTFSFFSFLADLKADFESLTLIFALPFESTVKVLLPSVTVFLPILALKTALPFRPLSAVKVNVNWPFLSSVNDFVLNAKPAFGAGGGGLPPPPVGGGAAAAEVVNV